MVKDSFSFMAEETAIFGGVGCGQRLLFARTVAALAELFRLFFSHGHESFMILIMGERPRGFRWGLQQKIQQCATPCQKQCVGNKVFVLGSHAVVRSKVKVR
jgi:hypothetical protein